MHARLTRFKLKPGKREEWTRLREELADEIHAFKGLRHWIGLVAENEVDVVVVAVYDGAEGMEESMPAVRRVWERFAHMMDEQPSAERYEVARFDSM